jgi:hypothetical protein
MVPNFPNLFLVAAPGSPSIRVQGILIGEVQVDWIEALMSKLRNENIDRVEPTPDATSSWTAYVAETANRGLLARNETQYVGANVPGKPRVYSAYLGGLPLYRAICNLVAEQNYTGFIFRKGDDTTCAETQWAGPPEGVLQVSAI